MCFSSGNKAAEEARRQEEERQQEIREAQRRVEQIFGSPEREAQIQDLIDATRGFLTTDLDRQKADVDRGLKFALARSGLSGGSADIDQNRRLAEDYLRGILEVERRAETAGSDLRSQDFATKTSLFQQALGGLDATTAAQQAGQALQQNVALAKSGAFQQGLGDLFGDFGDIFKLSREREGERRAAFDFNTFYGPRPTSIAQVSGATPFGGGR